MKIKKKKGFTLVELVITISIIVVLSSVGVPIYKKHIWNARLSEGYLLLATVRDAQLQYHNEYGNFLLYSNGSSTDYYGWTCNEPILGVDARANKYFTDFTVNSGAQYQYLTPYYFAARVRSGTAQKTIQVAYNVTSGMTYNFI